MRAHHGFTLTELPVALAMSGLVIGGVIGFFVSQTRLGLEEEVSASVDDSLRLGLVRISDPLRGAVSTLVRARGETPTGCSLATALGSTTTGDIW